MIIMLKIKVKPIYMDAWKWDESRKTFNTIGCARLSCSGHVDRPDEMTNLKIITVNGSSNVNKGDYIIKSINGDFFVVDEDYFKKRYDIIKHN